MPGPPGTSSGEETAGERNDWTNLRRHSAVLDRTWDKGLFCIVQVKKFETSEVLMRNEAEENGVDGDQRGESVSRPSMRAFGRSASTKIMQGLDWNR